MIATIAVVGSESASSHSGVGRGDAGAAIFAGVGTSLMLAAALMIFVRR